MTRNIRDKTVLLLGGTDDRREAIDSLLTDMGLQSLWADVFNLDDIDAKHARNFDLIILSPGAVRSKENGKTIIDNFSEAFRLLEVAPQANFIVVADGATVFERTQFALNNIHNCDIASEEFAERLPFLVAESLNYPRCGPSAKESMQATCK